MYMHVCIHVQYRNLIATIIKEQLIPDWHCCATTFMNEPSYTVTTNNNGTQNVRKYARDLNVRKK